MWQCGRTFPISNYLLNFLLSLPQSAVYPGIPLSLQNNPKFPSFGLEVITKKLFTSFKNQDSSLLNEITSLPTKISSCFGFSNTFYIYDHIDLADLETGISETHLIDSIIFSLKDQLFLFSVKSQVYAEQLKELKNQYISIENLISSKSISNLPRIGCTSPTLRIEANACHGYPQYLHRYKKVAEQLSAADSCINEAQKARGFLSAAALTKLRFAKNDLIHLCRDLIEIEPELFNEDIVDNIVSSTNCRLSLKKSTA